MRVHALVVKPSMFHARVCPLMDMQIHMSACVLAYLCA